MTEHRHADFATDFERALTFAARLHATQVRKSTNIPYISHLMAVASLVLEHGGGRDEAIAALLHDSIEDQGSNYRGGVLALRLKIKMDFGERVLEIVDGCTDADVHPKPPWRERKEQYIVQLHAVPEYVRLVSCADKLHNARSIVADLRTLGHAIFDRFNAGRDGTLWYYRTLADTFLQLGPASLAQELELAVQTMEQVAARREPGSD